MVIEERGFGFRLKVFGCVFVIMILAFISIFSGYVSFIFEEEFRKFIRLTNKMYEMDEEDEN